MDRKKKLEVNDIFFFFGKYRKLVNYFIDTLLAQNKIKLLKIYIIHKKIKCHTTVIF